MKKYFKVNENLELIPRKDYTKAFKYSIALNILFIVLVITAFSRDPIKEIIYETKVLTDTVIVPADIKLNDSSITKELLKNGCILPAVAVAQSRIETGNYSSKVCRENKNLFGIKEHKCEYVLGTKNNHAYYKTYKDNIKCYIHVQNMYLKKIDGKYAEAKGYVGVLKSMKK